MKRILLIFILMFSINSFSSKIVTSNQLAYTFAKMLTQKTDIEVISAFDAYTDMFKQKISFKNLENKEEIFKNADAVVSLSSILEDDFLYEQARRFNIKVVNIDLGYSYRENSNLVLLKKENTNGIWLDFANMYKMIDILALDLSDIYPRNKGEILNNAYELKEKLIGIYTDFIDYTSNSNKDISVLQVGNNELDYFLDSLEIFHEDVENDIAKIKEAIETSGIKRVVFYKNLGKKVKNELNKLGVKQIKLSLGNIPLDLDEDEKMDVDGYIQILKQNIENLKKGF